MKCYPIVFLALSFMSASGFSKTSSNFLGVGVGLSSSYSGRYVPGLHLAAGYKSLQIAVNSSGVKTDIYEHRTTQASFYYQWDTQAYLTTVRAAIGLGLANSYRQYREHTSQDAEKGSETVSGIASKLEILFSDHFFVAIETLNGKGQQSSRLIFKPFAQIILGVSI